MNAIQTEVAKRIAILANSIGATYALRVGDETTGTLEVPPVRAPKHKTHVKVYNFTRDTGYTEVTSKMQPGDVYKRDVASGDYARSFEATLRAYARKHWGKDSYIAVSVPCGDVTTVELLRVL